jgi:putative SOS response-associated peptidase YedK
VDAIRAGMPQYVFEEFSEHGRSMPKWKPRFNVAPSQVVDIVRVRDGRGVIESASWGLIPHWTKGKPKLKSINARADTLASSGMFRQAFEKRRCLIPADGFYEWKGAKPPKQPYFIHRRDDAVFAFAGLWEKWKPEPDAEPIETFTIITTTPNALMETIHNRMPVILDPKDYDRWVDPGTPCEGVVDLLKPSDPVAMEAWSISTKVNSVKNDGLELLEPE